MVSVAVDTVGTNTVETTVRVPGLTVTNCAPPCSVTVFAAARRLCPRTVVVRITVSNLPFTLSLRTVVNLVTPEPAALAEKPSATKNPPLPTSAQNATTRNTLASVEARSCHHHRQKSDLYQCLAISRNTIEKKYPFSTWTNRDRLDSRLSATDIRHPELSDVRLGPQGLEAK